jgi:predicted AlkP superfamily phosphohydrolase/phosphomutase
MTSQPGPLVIMGLDGATFDLINPLMSTEHLPNIKRLMEGGQYADLLSTNPPVTLPAWTSFITGVPPGQHGVTDIFLHPDKSYQLRPVNARHRMAPTFFSEFSRHGLSTVSLGIPGTFPPEPLSNNVTISGFDTPGAAHALPEAFHPSSVYTCAKSHGGWRYGTFNEYQGGKKNLGHAVKKLLENIDRQEAIALEIYKQRPWDVFFLHLQASDTAGHHLWHTYDSDSPRHKICSSASQNFLPQIYHRLDQCIGTFLKEMPSNARFLIVSDHGMGGAGDIAIYLNRFLASLELLHFQSNSKRAFRQKIKRMAHKGLEIMPIGSVGNILRYMPGSISSSLLALARGVPIDFSRTIAFSDELDYAPSVWINRRDRFAQGNVHPKDASQYCDVIIEALLELRSPECPETRLIKKVHRRQDIMDGPYLNRVPDLIIEPAWPQNYRSSFLPSPGPGVVVEKIQPHAFAAPKGGGMPGVHRPEGVFILYGPGISARKLPPIHIHQAGCMLYDLFDLKRPAHLETFTMPILPHLKQSKTSPAEDLIVSERLRALGYLP